MAAAQKRWEAQVRDGTVRNVTPAEVKAVLGEGWTLLDVRPPTEIAKAQLQGAVEVPLFVLEEEASVGNLIKQSTAFGMGGWWLGGGHMKANPAFLADVQARIPKDAKVVVVCQKGLRSLAACEALSRAGYSTLSWINGGLDVARPGELPTKGDVDIRLGGAPGGNDLGVIYLFFVLGPNAARAPASCPALRPPAPCPPLTRASPCRAVRPAGVGGLSEVLGWTEPQREAGAAFAGGYQNLLKGVGVILALDIVWFLWTITHP
jgi:rhodanese-related sulfurtransferase